MSKLKEINILSVFIKDKSLYFYRQSKNYKYELPNFFKKQLRQMIFILNI